jgi:hypothetical protein
VTPETKQFLELLEQRIALLGSLGEALAAARTDVVSFDLDGLESRISLQERLCTEIRTLDSEIDHVQSQCSAHLNLSARKESASGPNPDTRRLRDTVERLSQVQASVKQLNDAHQALLRRSRRTVGALLNSYHSFAMTYSDPASPRAAVGERL